MLKQVPFLSSQSMLEQENELPHSQSPRTDSVLPFCVGLDPALRAAIGYPCLAQICLVAFLLLLCTLRWQKPGMVSPSRKQELEDSDTTDRRTSRVFFPSREPTSSRGVWAETSGRLMREPESPQDVMEKF